MWRDPRPYFDEALAAFATYENERAKITPTPSGHDDNLPIVMERRSEIHYEEGRNLAAIEAATAAEATLDEKRSRDNIRWSRGQSYLALKQPELAIVDLEKVSAANLDVPEIAAKLADAHWQSGDVETARRIYGEIDARLAKAGHPPFDPGLRDHIAAILPLERADAPSETAIYAALARAFPAYVPALASAPPPSRMFGLVKGKPWSPSSAPFASKHCSDGGQSTYCPTTRSSQPSRS